jgi:hypothetical protein
MSSSDMLAVFKLRVKYTNPQIVVDQSQTGNKSKVLLSLIILTRHSLLTFATSIYFDRIV